MSQYLLIFTVIQNKNNWFIYGNSFDRSKKKSEYWQVRFLAKILNRIAPMFSYDSCAFNNFESKNTTARAVIGKDIGILNWFTLESSFNAFKYFNMKNKRFCLWKYTIDDYHMMGEFLVKGFFATIKAFYDDEDGIEYNIHINKSNRELADNSIIVNTLARKAQAEILDAKPFKHKSKFRLKNTSRKPNSKKQVDESSTNEKLDKNQSFSDLIESSFLDDSNFISSLIGDYSQKLEENINKMIKESEEETKEGDYPTQNKMIKIMEEEDEYLDSDSNEDDSNSDPSEDNFSEGEINECFNKVFLIIFLPYFILKLNKM